MASEIACLKESSSSMFSHAGYSDAEWALYLQFRSTGELRRYKDVSPEVGDEAMSAKSLGTWFNQTVRGNRSWEYDIIPGPEPEPKAKPKEKSEPDGTMLTDADLDSVFGQEGETLLEISAEPEPSEALAVQSQPEILGVWTTPTNAQEAITLLREREHEIDAIIKKNTERQDSAFLVRVTDQESNTAAGAMLTEYAGLKDKTVALLDPFRSVLYESYKFAGSRKDAAVGPLEKAIEYLKGQMLGFKREQDRLQREAQEAARRRAEEEARRQQEELSKKITLAEIDDKLAEGKTEEAEQLLLSPVEVPKPYVAPEIIAPSYTKAAGTSTTKKYKVDEDALADEADRMRSIEALLIAVRDGKYDLKTAATHLDWNIKKLNKLVEGMGQAFNVPGLLIREVESMRVRRSK